MIGFSARGATGPGVFRRRLGSMQALAGRLLATTILLVFSSSLHAHKPRQPSIEDQTENAELIVIADVTGTGPGSPDGWLFENSWHLRVTRVLKGQGVPVKLEMVTDSMGDHFAPDCCEAGKRYLMFLNRGYPLFEDSKGDELPRIVLQEVNRYVSSASDAYGIYELIGDHVRGWPGSNGAARSLEAVEGWIRDYRRVPSKNPPVAPDAFGSADGPKEAVARPTQAEAGSRN